MAEPREETQAVVTLIARSFGFDAWPLPDGSSAPLTQDAQQAATMVADATSIPPPVKLDLLAQLSRQGMDEGMLVLIAESLVEEGVGPRVDVVGALLERVSASRPGEDALGRDARQPALAGDVLDRFLRPSIRQIILRILPSCKAATKSIRGHRVLSIRTELDVPSPLRALKPVADPLEWPKCPVQASFFKSMTEVTPRKSLEPPAEGWSARLREKVDFSFGSDPTGSSIFTTDLDFTYVEDDTAVTCDFHLGESQGQQIRFDSGFVRIQDLVSRDIRQIVTLKEVAFTSRPHPGDVCEVWSRAHAAAAASCLSTAVLVAGSDL